MKFWHLRNLSSWFTAKALATAAFWTWLLLSWSGVFHNGIVHCLWIWSYPFWAVFSCVAISVKIYFTLFEWRHLRISCQLTLFPHFELALSLIFLFDLLLLVPRPTLWFLIQINLLALILWQIWNILTQCNIWAIVALSTVMMRNRPSLLEHLGLLTFNVKTVLIILFFRTIASLTPLSKSHPIIHFRRLTHILGCLILIILI